MIPEDNTLSDKVDLICPTPYIRVKIQPEGDVEGRKVNLYVNLCPTCRMPLMRKNISKCPNCGQIINWDSYKTEESEDLGI